MELLQVVAVLSAGVFLGYLVASLMWISKDSDERAEKQLKERKTASVVTIKSVDNSKCITEVCPECGRENTIEWDVDKDGYEAYCSHCGTKMMLCDECFHSEDNEGHRCDWCEKGCFRAKENVK